MCGRMDVWLDGWLDGWMDGVGRAGRMERVRVGRVVVGFFGVCFLG